MNDAYGAALYFDKKLVALLGNVFCDQGTWHADYCLAFDLSGEMLDFIRFNRECLCTGEFNDKTLRGYQKFCETDHWRVPGTKERNDSMERPFFATRICRG